MFKAQLNNDSEHIIHVNNINYNINFQVGQDSTRDEHVSCTITNADLETLNLFENQPITKMRLYDEEDNLLATLNFSNNFYLTTGNINIYDNDSLFQIIFNTVVNNSN